MTSHPRADDWQAFLLGTLPEADTDRLAEHLEQCPACQSALPGALPGDPLVAALRRPLAAEAHSDEPECQSALAALSRDVLVRIAGVTTVAPPSNGSGTMVSPTGDPFPALPCTFGRYRIERRLGKGGMGHVYLAHDGMLDRPVALKVSRFGAREGEAVERFLREARSAAGLQHEGICRVLDFGSVDGVHFLTMDYVDGEPLAKRVEAGGAKEPRRAAELVRQVALALDAAHRAGVVHRDLKPANIMLGTDGRPRVVDFGVARRAGDSTLTQAGATVGTPAYMSPEQIQGEPVGPASDVYSLGVILYELLTGRLPFNGQNLAQLTYQIVHGKTPPPSQYRPDLDPALESICLTAMARPVEERYPSMADFAQALGDYLTGAARPTPLRKSVRRRPSKLKAALTGRWWQVFFGLMLAATVTLGVLVVVLPRSDDGLDRDVALVTPDRPGPKPAPPPPPPPPQIRAERPMPLGGVESLQPPAPPVPGSAKGTEAGPLPSPPTVMFTPATARADDAELFARLLRGTAWLVVLRRDGLAGNSAVLVDRPERLLLTANHSTYDVEECFVHFPMYRDGKVVTERGAYLERLKGQGDAIRARVVARDPKRDLALVQAERLPEGLQPLPLADRGPDVGVTVHSIGTPGVRGPMWVYSVAAVRQAGRRQVTIAVPGKKHDLDCRWFEAGNPLDPDDSGGPVVNVRGELVGIRHGGSPQGRGLTLCIDQSEVRDFVKDYFKKKGIPWPRPAVPE